GSIPLQPPSPGLSPRDARGERGFGFTRPCLPAKRGGTGASAWARDGDLLSLRLSCLCGLKRRAPQRHERRRERIAFRRAHRLQGRKSELLSPREVVVQRKVVVLEGFRTLQRPCRCYRLGTERDRTETGRTVVAQNILRQDALQRQCLTPVKIRT